MKSIALGLVLSFGGWSCGDSTELVVVVDTDLRVGDEVRALDVSASADGFADTHRFETSADTPLPLTFSVGPNGSVDEDVHLRVAALDEAGNPLVTWLAVTRFREGRSLEIPAPLARACASADDLCDGGMVCRNGACEPLFVDPRELQPSGTREGRIFEGPSEPMLAPTCEDRAAGGEACRPGCPCVDRLTCVTGTLTCTPVADGVEEGCLAESTSLPFEGATTAERDAFEATCRELKGALCQNEGRECL